MLDLNQYAKKALKIAEKRQANWAGIKTDTYSMLKHCATEVVEATEAYSYYFNEIPQSISDIDLSISDIQIKNKEAFSKELADVICCALIIAAKEEVNIERALEEVQEKNSRRSEGIVDKLKE